MRLVNSIPDWEPATKNGKPYSVDQTVPVTFNYSKEKNRIFLEDILTTKPEFPGGKNKYHEFLSKNVRYPINALERGTGDFLIISFIIENDGTISNIEPYTESIAMFSRAIEKVLKASPKWNPGKINNRSVRTQMFLPVLFTTDEKIDASQYPENTFYIRAFSTIKSIRIF